LRSIKQSKNKMNYIETTVRGVWLIEPQVFEDARGYFFETFKKEEFERHVGQTIFIQENESRSTKGVLRGLHYQTEPYSQAKLVRIIQGSVLDVAVDLRKESPTFLKHIAVELSSENRRQLFIPRGFAHGFHVLSDSVVFTYKVDNPYSPAFERSIRYNDPQIGIDWLLPDGQTPLLSEKDRNAPFLAEIIHIL